MNNKYGTSTARGTNEKGRWHTLLARCTALQKCISIHSTNTRVQSIRAHTHPLGGRTPPLRENHSYVKIDGQIYYKANSVAREEDEEEDAVEDRRNSALADEEDVRRNLYGT